MNNARPTNARIVNGTIELEREITALDIARALASAGGKYIEPTAEQRAIIESKHFGPTVIIAGAGSGKTETMSQRVLWLIANGVVSADQILGLTFTRKAASELAIRIRKRLRQLRQAGLIPTIGEHGAFADIAVDVSTYHSYAGKTLAEHGIRMGIDTDGEPLGEAAAWQLTYSIVNSFAEVDAPIFHSPDTIVDEVMTLSSQIGEHNADVAAVREFLLDFADRLTSLGPKTNETVRSALEVIQERIAILPMVEKSDTHRLAHGQLTFDDQMSYAARLVEAVPEISEIERARYKVVLLDEYQDTSYAQVRFLTSLFGAGHAVTAVGDPNQAIYGWRGASAETLDSFGESFSVNGNYAQYELLTTWRNDQRILDFSNIVIDHIAASSLTPFGVKRLCARPDASNGELRAGIYVTQIDEAEAIADYFAQLWNEPTRLAKPENERSSFAVLVRAKSYIPAIEMALRERGLPTEVIGVGGLVHIPEIADIIALLRLMTYPDAGTALARLLAGPRLALGALDIAGLGKYSRDLARTAHSRKTDRLEEVLEYGSEATLDAQDFAMGSIIDALDSINDAPAEYFSKEGFSRLKKFSHELQQLRRNMNGSITDKIQIAEKFLGLDVETLVRDGWENGRRHLDKFLDEAAAFARTGGSLANFLAWLESAEKREGGLKPPAITVSNSAAQILTVHQSKGAEWDVVAVPGLVESVFPSSGSGTKSWIKYPGTLPIKFRGDHLQFTDFEYPRGDAALKPAEVKKAIDAFEDAQKARRLLEELRLGYVAFTRAKSHLFCTASWFREGKSANKQSVLFNLLQDYLGANQPDAIASIVEAPAVNPLIENPRSAVWPTPNVKRTAIRESAEKVLSAKPLDIVSALTTESNDTRLSLLNDASALIQEAAARNATQLVYLPNRLSVSTLISLGKDPAELALNIRRPMPRHTDRFAKRGTEFHLWVERQFGALTLFDEDLFDPFEPAEVELKELQEKWLNSPWAKRTPIAVEEGFETVINGVVIRGRIDAIYKTGDIYEVVDWKTGRAKVDEELQVAATQLAMYRLAYSKQHGIPLTNIRAAFYYVADDRTVFLDQLASESEIEAMINQIEEA